MGQLGIRIANVALFTVCCFQVATVFNEVSANYLRPGPAAFAATAPEAGPLARDWHERQPILDRNLFGAQTFAVDMLPVVDPDEKLEETKLPVTLLGTQVHSVRAHSKAAITDRGSRDHELLREGDTLEKHPQARVVRIERGRVVLDNKGRREELLLAEADTGLAARAPEPPDRSSRRRSRRASTREPAAESLTDRLRDLNKANGGLDMGTIFSQGRLLPKWEDGALVGMELHDVEPDSIYEKVGLQEGNVITSVNGIALDDAAAASKLLPELAKGGSIEITTLDGPPITIDDLGALASGDDDE